jgi:hypothetical protein
VDFSVIFKLRTKRLWWLDVLFYFVVSVLIAAVFCYIIFFVKNSLQKKEISQWTVKLQTVGTDQQKQYEKSVVKYQGKLISFANLLKNHEFPSHVFGFMQDQTIPDIWFKLFSFDTNSTILRTSGQASNMEALSRQVAIFENDKYVRKVNVFNSSTAKSAAVEFNIDLQLDSKIVDYIHGVDMLPLMGIQNTVSPSDQGILAQGDGSTGKMITVFDFSLNPEVIGRIDQENHTIDLDVPFGTDVSRLQPLVAISPGARVVPGSGVAEDFSNPIVYTVTAGDGSAQDYTVRVNILSGESSSSQIKPGYVAAFLVVVLILIVVATVLIAFFVFKRKITERQNKIL